MLFKIFFAFLVFILVFFALFPIFWMVIISGKPIWELQGYNAPLFPSEIAWDNYSKMWRTVPLLRYIINGFVVSIFTVVVSLLISIPGSYAISRYRFRGRKSFSMLVLATQLFPGVIILVPLFVIYANIQKIFHIKLLNTYQGMIVAFATFAIPYSIWMMRSYFDSIPVELEQAAMIDGCNSVSAMIRVVLPIVLPGIVATGMYVFLLAWNNLLFAGVLSNQTTRTFSVGLQQFSSEFTREYGQLMAACTVTTIPLLVMFLAFQRHIIAGMTGGAVKG
jgi:multiple sugar transport system permease protein